MPHFHSEIGELEKVLFLPIGDEKKEWILSKNPKRLVRLQ
jgi:predicted TIM-barrel fold metal-dependent hydrolase